MITKKNNNKKINGGVMKKLLTLMAFVFIQFAMLQSQSLQIVSIDYDNYPDIRMEFKATDANNNEIRSFNVSDFIIEENCSNKEPNLVQCPPPGQSKVSYIFTLDRSPSMFDVVPGTGGLTKGDQVKRAFAEMLKYMPDPRRWEAAVISFAGQAWIMQEFTNDKVLLQKAVDETYKTSRAQTDFNAGFLFDYNGNPGALTYAKNALYKPVVIFMTDGEHNFQTNVIPSRTNVWEGLIIAEANNLVISTGEQIPATIFALTLGYPMPSYLENIATSTPDGEAIESSLSAVEITRIMVSIVNTSGTLGPPSPCQLVWTSCCLGGNLNFTCKLNGITVNETYTVPDALKPHLEIDQLKPYFSNVNPGDKKVINVKVTARKNFVLFDKDNPVVLSNAKFKILSPSLNQYKLQTDSSITLQLEYTSSDSNYAFTDITFNSSACSGNQWAADAGWLFQRTVYVGSGTVGNPKDIPIQGVICNYTGRTVSINSMVPSGGDAADFDIVSPKPPYTLPSDSCITIAFRFEPASEGRKSTTLLTVTNDGSLSSELWGDGSGFPEISVTPSNNITFPNTNCRTQWQDTTITITNMGALVLDVSSINLSNSTDFERIGWPAIPFSLEPNQSQGLVVRFAPKSLGLKTSVMNITSNSKNNPSYDVNLSGTKDSIGFNLSNNSLDFGELCSNEQGSRTLTLTNSGTVDITINAADDGNYSVAPNTWTIAPGATQNVNVVFVSATEGTFNGTIEFKDNYCDFTKIVSTTAGVANPAISSIPISIQSTVGSNTDGTSRITNSSERDLTINSYNIPCDEMTIVSPALPWNIPAGGYIDLVVKYTPVNDNFVNCFISLEGNPCNFLDSIEVNGNPDLATATIQIEKHSGYAGFDIQIPIHLRNLNKVIESGAASINTRINYDQNLLVNPRISNGTVNQQLGYIDISNMAIVALSGDVLAVLTFTVGNSNPTTTPLEFINTVSIGGGVNFTEIDGEFTLLISSAEIAIETTEGKTGETVNIPIKLLNAQNIVDEHESIQTTLTYNYSVLQPVGNTPTGIIDDDLRIIELSLPTEAGADDILETLQFRVMLGTEGVIPLLLTNTKTGKGIANFVETSGKFTVTDICISGDPNNLNFRLFDPKGLAQILNISPNPANGETVFTFEAQEEGIHNIAVYSSIGTKIADLMDKQIKPGVYELHFNTENVSTGSYFIIYQTPTKLITAPLNILK